jgi:hypothetical protein
VLSGHVLDVVDELVACADTVAAVGNRRHPAITIAGTRRGRRCVRCPEILSSDVDVEPAPAADDG